MTLRTTRARWSPVIHGLAIKSQYPHIDDLYHRFAARADVVINDNARMILAAISARFDPPLAVDDLPSVADAKAALLAEWSRRIEVIWTEFHAHPHHLDPIREGMEAHLLRGFAGLVNELRQRGLGIESYVWRSRDDGKVRSSHARFDDQRFNWDDPPEGGHPGQDFNCRCRAEPALPDEPDYVPDTGIAYTLARLDAEAEGMAHAAKDAAAEVWEGLRDLPGQLAVAGRYARLLGEEALGTLSASEQAELAQMRRALDARIDQITALVKDSPRLARAFADYVQAVRARPAMVDEAYRAGLATLGQVQEAHRERAYLDTLILSQLVPGKLFTRLLRRRGRHGDLERPEDLADDLVEMGMHAARHPSDTGWDVIANPGMVWRGLAGQGRPWEDYLETTALFGDRLPWSHKTFDFFDRETRTATSAKTLDTQALTYLDRPSRIYGRLRGYVDEVATFRGDKRFPGRVPEGGIVTRRLELAVPYTSTPEQVIQIQRAIEYAAEKGIDVTVSFIQ